MQSFYNDEHAVRELTLFAQSSRDLYPARAQNEKLAKQQIEQGTYDVRAWQLIWRGWFDEAAELYVREFPGEVAARTLFPERVRMAAAKDWEEYARELVGEGASAAGALYRGAKPNPLARAGYPRRAALQRDLERYYKDCQSSSTAHHLQGGKKRKAAYCSAVSWKRARMSGRYNDYPTMKENPLSSTQKALVGVGLLGAAVVGYLVYKGTAAPSTPVYVTIVPGPMTVSSNGSGTVYAVLPTNAAWVAVPGGQTPNGPAAFPVGPGSSYFVWTDAAGNQQKTTLNVPS